MNALLLLFSMLASFQASELSPVHPQQGDTITLRYDAAAPDAALSGPESIFATLKIMAPSGTVHRAIALKRTKGVALEGSIVLPDDATYVRAHFATKQREDTSARIQSMVFDADETPVQGARVHRASGATCLDQLTAELEEHPESYAAYRKKWFYKSLVYGERELWSAMEADLQAIGDAESADALFARSYIHMLRGEEPLARASVLEALASAPTATATSRAVTDYLYASTNSEGIREVRRALHHAMSAHPGGHVARDQIYSQWGSFEHDVVRDICSAWKQSEPLNPLPDAILAASCKHHGRTLDEGSAAATRALNGFLDGTAELASLDNLGLREAYVPWCAIVAAGLAEARGDVVSAIAYAKLYQDVAPNEAAFGLEKEAQLWERLGDRGRASDRFVHAFMKGSPTAKDALRQRWRSEHGSDDGFESHLTVSLQSRRSTNERVPAPSFACTDMSGNRVSLESLRGRVVVLNFWSLGCVPCKKEIPSLNDLVRDYEDEPVEFLAFAPDHAGDVAHYTKERSFDYRLIAHDSEASVAFDVTSWPTHVVLDASGRLVARLTGAGEGQPARIAALIDLALRDA